MRTRIRFGRTTGRGHEAALESWRVFVLARPRAGLRPGDLQLLGTAPESAAYPAAYMTYRSLYYRNVFPYRYLPYYQSYYSNYNTYYSRWGRPASVSYIYNPPSTYTWARTWGGVYRPGVVVNTGYVRPGYI